MKYWYPIESIIIFAIIAILSAFFVAPFIRLPVEVAKIEEVRTAVSKIKGNEAEDILGQALEINKTIAKNRALNKMWWADCFIPDGWESVAKIDILCRQD